MDRLTSMAVFAKAVEAGSFAAAAADLGISAPMVGKHVRYLEDRLGVRLLARTTRRQSPTEVGRDFYERCRVVLAEVETAEAVAAQSRAPPRPRLRVNAPVTFGAHRLAPALADYLAANPDVTVDLSLNDRMVDLVEEGYEAAIRVGPLADSGLIARPLAPYELVLCAAPSYLAARGAPAHPDELRRHECMGFAHWAPGDAWSLEGAEGTVTVRVGGRFSANSGQALREAALRGFGIVLQAETLLAEDLAAGRLVRVLPEYRPPSRPMHLLYVPDRRPTPKLRTFIDFVVGRFGAPSPRTGAARASGGG